MCNLISLYFTSTSIKSWSIAIAGRSAARGGRAAGGAAGEGPSVALEAGEEIIGWACFSSFFHCFTAFLVALMGSN